MSNVLQTIIEGQKSCMVIPHQSPDGDCLGSAFALSRFLDNHKCENIILMDDVIPSNYLFLKKDNMFDSQSVLNAKRTYDYVIILDTSSKDRIGADPKVLTMADTMLVIDHHKTNSYFGDINIVEMLSSVGEILFNMITACGDHLDQEIAKGLYTSIVTDTGEFRYSNTESTSLKAVATLFETGFDFETINRHIYSNQPLGKVLLKSQALSEMRLYKDKQIAVMSVTQNMLESLSCEMFHSDGIVEAGRDIEGVEVSILLKEMEANSIKVSLRSKSYLDVSEVSVLHNGGGHARAAGCTISGCLDEVEALIVEQVGERII